MQRLLTSGLVFLPMAMDSPLLLETILAWSSTHLAFQNETYQTFALKSRGIALKTLAASITSHYSNFEVELACSLIHCAMESIAGDTRTWYMHLVGAYNIIRNRCSKRDLGFDFSPCETFEGRWLLRSFAYHDIMTAVSEDQRPLLVAGHYWSFDDYDVPDSYFGLGSKLLYYISEVSVLNADMLESRGGGLKSQLDYSRRAKFLEQDLLSWTHADKHPSHPLTNLAEMYRSAALIHLYRVIRRFLPDLTSTVTEHVTSCVVKIVNRLRTIPSNSLVESSLLFPLFMAGGETENAHHIEILRQRMLELIEFRHFRNVQAALSVLEETWHLRASGKQIDWRDVLIRRKWMISIT